MNLTREKFVHMVEAVALKDTTTYEDTVKLAEACRQYDFHICYGLNCFTPDLLQMLKNSRTLVGAPVGGSSIGCELEEVKLYDISKFLEMGCGEVDIIMNIPYLRTGRYELILSELKKARELVRNTQLKVIIQSGMLNEKEIRIASELVLESGADFVKTNTGFVGDTTIEQVKIIRETVKDKIQIKAAGGINGRDMIQQLLDLGVTRLGLSYGKAVTLAEQLS